MANVSDLEPLVYNAVRMASITVEIFERTMARPHEKKGGLKIFHLSKEQHDNLSFAIFETEAKIEAIEEMCRSLASSEASS